jgi:hypothetical protein
LNNIFDIVHLCRQLQDAHLRDQQPTDSLNQLITELISESPRQTNSDANVHVAATVTPSSVQSDCQRSDMSAHLFNYNSYPVRQCVVSSGGETSLQSEDERCSPSLISCAEEQGVTNVQQICLREQCAFTGNVKQKGNIGDGALLSRKTTQQDFLAGNTINGKCVQEMAEKINVTYTEFADGVATGSNAWNCSTQSIGDQNMDAVHNMECMGDVEMDEVESLASEILPASEVDGLDSSDKFSALTQAHLRDNGIPNYHEAKTLVTSDVSSVASTVIISSHDSVSTRVQRSCEDGGNSDCTVIACTDENEDMECQFAELHSSNVGCKQKFASG